MNKCSQIEMHRKETSMRRSGPTISALMDSGHPEKLQCLQEIIHAKESRFRNIENFLLVESGTVGFEIQNSAQGTPECHWRQRPESKFHWQRTGIIGNWKTLMCQLKEYSFLSFFYHPLSGGIFFCCFSGVSRYVATLQRSSRNRRGGESYDCLHALTPCYWSDPISYT